MKVYQLFDHTTGEPLGLVATDASEWAEMPDPDVEVKESWEEFNKLEEHELDPSDLDDFVEWNNENRVIQIERIFITDITLP